MVNRAVRLRSKVRAVRLICAALGLPSEAAFQQMRGNAYIIHASVEGFSRLKDLSERVKAIRIPCPVFVIEPPHNRQLAISSLRPDRPHKTFVLGDEEHGR